MLKSKKHDDSIIYYVILYYAIYKLTPLQLNLRLTRQSTMHVREMDLLVCVWLLKALGPH